MGDKKKKLKIVLFAGYACNNNCVFCIAADKRDLPGKSTAELLREVAEAARRGADIVEIIGGEATIRHDFAHIVSAAKKLGVPEVLCATNGRVFADPAAARRIVASGIDCLVFSVHGPSPAVHDRLTRAPGSFRQLERGLDNLARLGFDRVCGNTTVVKGNMRTLPRLAEFYARRGIRNVEYIFVDPTCGGALKNFAAVVPRISEAAPYMRAALAAGLRAGFSQWKARYVPLCHFRGFEAQISETNERELFLAEHWAQDFRNTDVIGSRAAVARAKTARCENCGLERGCEGIWREYLRVYGDSELAAVR